KAYKPQSTKRAAAAKESAQDTLLRNNGRPSARALRLSARAPATRSTGATPRALIFEASARPKHRPAAASRAGVGLPQKRTAAHSTAHSKDVTHASSVARAPLARRVGERHHSA